MLKRITIFALTTIISITSCGNNKETNTDIRKDYNSAKMNSDSLAIVNIAKNIIKCDSTISLYNFINKLGIERYLIKQNLKESIFGRTGPVFSNDDQVGMNLRELNIDIPLKKDVQKAHLLVKIKIPNDSLFSYNSLVEEILKTNANSTNGNRIKLNNIIVTNAALIVPAWNKLFGYGLYKKSDIP